VLALSAPALPAKRARSYAAFYMGRIRRAELIPPRSSIDDQRSRGPCPEGDVARLGGDPFDVSKFVALLRGRLRTASRTIEYRRRRRSLYQSLPPRAARRYLWTTSRKSGAGCRLPDAWLARMKQNGGVIELCGTRRQIGGPEGSVEPFRLGLQSGESGPGQRGSNRIPRAIVGSPTRCS
jgi:hypothetical protein